MGSACVWDQPVLSALQLTAPPLSKPPSSGLQRVLGVAARLALVVLVYLLYAYARDRHGVSSGPAALDTAREHASRISSWSDALGLPSERRLQHAFLHDTWLLRAEGAFYGSAHFLVTAATVLWLLVRRPRHFDRWASVLGIASMIGVGVFALYPVAPPRLMPEGTTTVDTLASVGGLWSYDHGFLERITDPFAALPSLHMVWAVWVAMVLCGSRRRWVRVAGVGYPFVTMSAVLLTGNHWYEDIIAGTLLVLSVAVLVHVVTWRLGLRRLGRS